MRTTLNIDDDLIRQLKEMAHKSGTPLRQIVNGALRRGLTSGHAPRPKKRYVCPAFDMGKPAINLDKSLTLAASLEDNEVIREIELRK
jgi:hypothetical protein